MLFSPFCHRLVVVHGNWERLVHRSFDHLDEGVVQLFQRDSCQANIDV